ncbi:hypothetical protein M501DRAFT_728279 [Patellaria atrata CBS 101060]|uniref:Sister chromatid cohesion protein Ctf8 n=1 Tax=Patellaria atrata CBS 101060 TaxID=1346257 RepID=A0A9P4SC20_9PEZI|nr:hypothetical protein M501DRAFT_728279 [Patellaria atrata CBS 101060]
MPTIPLHPRPSLPVNAPSNHLPPLLQTPTGLAIIEIQGTIKASTSSSTLPYTPIGKLIFPDYSSHNPPSDTTWMKRVYLFVGQHQKLTGEVKALPKPLAVVRKRVVCERGDLVEGEELEVVEVVRFKIVFSQRPEPVGNA